MEATMMHFTVERQTDRASTAWRSGSGMAVAGLIAIVIFSLLLIPTGAFAQEFRATISGTVTDASGAVVTGASITVTETQTGTINRTTSDGAGLYVVPFLPPGDYSITVTKKGFRSEERRVGKECRS